MERLLADPRNTPVFRMLEVQYRMADAIMGWSNNTFYEGKLTSGPGVGGQTLEGAPGINGRLLVTREQILLIDTGGRNSEEKVGEPASTREGAKGSYRNQREAKVVATMARNLTRCGVKQTDIGVISFYSAQVDQIKQRLAQVAIREIKISSVDGFQGQEKEVVILSAVRSNNRGEIGFLAEERRLNVALTRAKKLLIVVADRVTLQTNKTYQDFFEYIEEHGEMTVWGDGE